MLILIEAQNAHIRPKVISESFDMNLIDFDNFLAVWHNKVSGMTRPCEAYCVYFLPQNKNRSFLQEVLIFLKLEVTLQVHNLGARLAVGSLFMSLQ